MKKYWENIFGFGLIMLLVGIPTVTLAERAPEQFKSAHTAHSSAKDNVEEGRYLRALKLLDRALELASDDDLKTKIYYERGKLYREAFDNYHSALADLEKAYKLDSKDEKIQLERAYARIGFNKGKVQKESRKAQKLYNRGLARIANKKRPNPHQIGEEYASSIQDFTKALLNIPSTDLAIRIYMSRGDIYRWHFHNEKALKDYSEVIRLDPSFAVAYKQRGRIRRRDSKDAIADYTKSIQLDPTDPETYLLRGSWRYGMLRPYEDSPARAAAAADVEKASELFHQQGNQELAQKSKDFAMAIADPTCIFVRDGSSKPRCGS